MTTINWETEVCADCGMHFQVPEDYQNDREDDGKTFYCPNGHPQHYTDSTEDTIEKLENENRELRKSVRELRCRLVGDVGIFGKIKRVLYGGLYK